MDNYQEFLASKQIIHPDAGIKLCDCGCGNPAPIAKKNRAERGDIKGQPQRFCKNHHPRKYDGQYKETVGPLPTPCWTWHVVSDRGYGIIHIRRGVSKRAHVHNYEKKHGPVPQGLELDHLCRNRACGNPDHVEPVTHTENMRRSSTAKITIDVARQIRAEHASGGAMLKDLSVKFNLSIPSIHEVIKHKTWAEQ